MVVAWDLSENSGGEAEYGIRDRDAVTRMGNIIGDRASGVDVAESGRGDGGLMGRAKGVLDTATGQDIRKFEEFVEAATTVLVGVHRDQEALRGEVTGLEEAIRERQDGIDERLGGVDATITALREEFDAFRATNTWFVNRVVLVISIIALVLSAVSIALRFV